MENKMTNHPQQPNPTQDTYYPDDEIELIDYLRVLWKWKVFILLIVILCAGVAMGLTLVKYPVKQITECIISLNFSGIENHKNPDNTLFSKEQIITPAILTRATAFLQKKDKNLEDIRGMIDIKAVIPFKVQEKMEAAKKKKESYTFYPNQFSLTLVQEQDGIFSTGEKNQILLSIVDEYRKDFEKKYGEEPLLVIEFPDNFLADSDYLDVINTFKVRAHSFIDFLDSKIAKAGFFRSQKTSDSFIDIKNDLELLNNIEINKTEADIKTLKLTKNKKNLINLYRHKIRTIDVERKKKEKEALVAKNLLKDMKYLRRYETSKGAGSEKGETSLVLDTSFIKNLVKEDSSSFLLKTALEAGVNAKNLEVDKEYLEEEIIFLKEKEKEKEDITFVETNLREIEGRIVALSKRANVLNVEYLSRVVNNAVQIVSDSETSLVRSKSVEKIVLLASVVALFMAVFLAFFIEYIKNASKLSPANKRT
jgi:hypothetical protein